MLKMNIIDIKGRDIFLMAYLSLLEYFQRKAHSIL